MKNTIRDRIGVKAVESYSKYLCLPTMRGKSKKVIFTNLQDKLWKKIKGWKKKILSQAGKEVLIKSIAQPIPNYIMSCFKLPISYCSKMETLINKFWWGEGDNSKKIHWIAWETLCKPKNEGSLGFRNLQSFNEALMGKQCWRIITNEQSSMAKTLKARYYPRGNLLSAKLGYQPSFV